MVAHRYWRLVGVCTPTNGNLELSQARIYEAGTAADSGAVLTATFSPTSGALADLSDGVASNVVAWPFASHSAASFALVWDLGVGLAVSAPQFVFGGGTSAGAFLEDATVQYSDDGGYWEVFTTLVDLTYPGQSVIAAPPGGDLTVTNPILFSYSRSLAMPTTGWQDLQYGAGLYVATTSASVYATSPDTITWTQRAFPSSTASGSLAFGAGIWVSVSTSNAGAYMTSTDGTSWTARTLPLAYYTSKVAFLNGKFYIPSRSGNQLLYSTDGTTWTATSLPGGVGWWRDMTYAVGVYVAVSYDSPVPIATSSDGVTWAARTVSAPYQGWVSVVHANGFFVSVNSDNSLLAKSLDGVTWATNSVPAVQSGSTRGGLGYSEGVFFIYDNSNLRVWLSVDATDWSISLRLSTWPYAGHKAYLRVNGKAIIVSDNNTFDEIDVRTVLYEVSPANKPRKNKFRASAGRVQNLTPTLAPSATTAHSCQREYPFFDAYNGGIGIVYGTVAEKHLPANTPWRRRVLLLDERSRIVIRETWSDATTGAYEFRGVKAGVPYTVVSYDHTGAYRAVIADAQLPELIT